MSEEESTSQEKPEVFAVKQGKHGWQFSRRGFLAATAATAVLAAGCKASSDIIDKLPTSSPTDTPTPEPTATSTATRTPEPTATPTVTPTPKPTVDPEIVMQNCLSVQGHNGVIGYLAISADGSFMVTAAEDYTIKLWSLPDAQLLATKTMEQLVINLAISPDGTELAIQNNGGEVDFYSIPDLTLTHTLTDTIDGSYAYCLAYSPDGTLLATGCDDNKVRIWSLPDLTLIRTLEDLTASVYSVVYSPDGSLLAAGTYNEVCVWSVSDGQLVKMQEGLSSYVDRLVFSQDGTKLASHDYDNMINVWSIPDWDILVNQYGNTGMAFSPDGYMLMFGGYANEIIFLSVDGGFQVKSIYGHNTTVRQVAISPDGTLLVTGDDIGQIKLWSFPEGNIVGCAMDLAASPDTAEGITYEATTESGETVTYTLPCGSELPAGAVCVCNCVAGTNCSCVGYTACSCDGYSPCSCDSYSSGGGSHYWYPD